MATRLVSKTNESRFESEDGYQIMLLYANLATRLGLEPSESRFESEGEYQIETLTASTNVKNRVSEVRVLLSPPGEVAQLVEQWC